MYRVKVEYYQNKPLWKYRRETDFISRVVVDELVFESTGDPDDHNGQIRIKDHFSVLLYIRFVSYVKLLPLVLWFLVIYLFITIVLILKGNKSKQKCILFL